MNDDMLRPSTPAGGSRLTCGQCDRMMQDALDGTLLPEDQTQFDLHLAGCPDCRRLFDEMQQGLTFLLDLKQAPPEPPSLLLSRILAQTSGDPAIAIPLHRNEPLLAGTAGTFPAGHMATVLPFQQPVRRAWPARMLNTAMQPRFAMTAAMAFFSIALTMNLVGVSPRDFHLSSLKPSSLRRDIRDVNNRVARYYNGIRVVYELESRVNEIRQSDDDSQQQGKAAPAQKQPDKPADNPGSHSSLKRPSRAVLALLQLPSTLHSAASAAGNSGEGAPA